MADLPLETKIDFQTTPPDLFQRMARYPEQLDDETRRFVAESMLHVWGSVPPYPPRPGSKYERTGLLGKSLGVDKDSGAQIGQPSIFKMKRFGAGQGAWEGSIGTRLHYAPQVIGDGTQKPIHRGIWWTMSKVMKLAIPGIQRLAEKMTGRMAKFLEGR